MTATELAPTETYQAKAVKTRSQAGRVTGKLAEAIELMIEQAKPWDEAARAVGFTARTMRKALDRPHVQAHIRHRREVFRNSVCTANIRRLAEIRDAANNMPAVQAIRALELIDEEQRQATGTAAQSPGLVIVINSASGVALTGSERDASAKPLIEHTSDLLTEGDAIAGGPAGRDPPGGKPRSR